MTNQQRMDEATALKIICAEAVQAYYYAEIKAGEREPLPANGLSNAKKQRVLEAYDHRCNYCGATDNLEIDHIWPRSKGGQHWMINLQPLCKTCHDPKGDKLVLRSPEAVAVLIPVIGPCLRPLARWALLVVAWIIRLVAAHPYATAAVVSVTAACLAVRWLREEMDGERRYARIGRAVKTEAQQRAERAKDAVRAFGSRTCELARAALANRRRKTQGAL